MINNYYNPWDYTVKPPKRVVKNKVVEREFDADGNMIREVVTEWETVVDDYGTTWTSPNIFVSGSSVPPNASYVEKTINDSNRLQ